MLRLRGNSVGGGSAALVAWIVLLYSPAASHGAPMQTVTTTAASFNGLAVSNTDLLQTSLSSVNVTGYSALVFSGTSFGQPNPVLINGSAQGNTTATSDWPNLVLEDSFSGGNDAIWSAVFNLNLTNAPFGYDITEIDTFAGWDTGRGGQVYDLYLSKVGDPAFYQIPSGIGGPQGNGFGTALSTGSSKIAITDPAGFLGVGIDAIRFDVNGTFTNGPVLREFDVLGVAATPEPTAIVVWTMLGAIGLVAYGWRRKRSA